MDTKKVFLRLALLYWENDRKELAVNYVLRSVKELEIIDAFGSQLLFKQFTV